MFSRSYAMPDPSQPAAVQPATARGRKTRKKLLAAAEALFGAKGFHGTSVVDITREAGVGQGTFYLYFESKEEVFGQLVRHLSQQLRQALGKAIADADHRLDVEELGVREFIRFSAEHRDLYQIVSESQFIDPELFRWYYERLARGYSRGLRQAMDAGEVVENDPETVSYCLMGASHFLGIRWVAWEKREPPEHVIQATVAFIRRALAPDPEP
jgi:AcrR family transcriptional regulator